jgi:ABC-type enterobactin transport system permease subunit
MGSTVDIGVRLGTLLTAVAFGALAGLPISGAIYWGIQSHWLLCR